MRLKLIHMISQARRMWQEKILSHQMHKRMAMMLSVVFILFGGIFGYKFIKVLMMPHPAPSPVSVSSTVIRRQEWQSKLRSVGTLRAIHGVDITTELAGMVKKIHLTPGSQVKTGDILLELNTDAEMAHRNSLRAIADLAEMTCKRDKFQLAVQAISQATLDFSKADLRNKKAQLAQQEAIIAKKIIRAPFSGLLGISAVNLGQYINAGDKIITLQSLDPIYVDFFLPQQALSSVKVGQKITLTIDAYPDQKFMGNITSMDPKIDPETRNIQIEATIANPESKLYPGMFGEVEIYTGASQNMLVLPKTAISFNPFGEIAYIIRETGKDKEGKAVLSAKQTFVTVGESRGDEVTVLKGLKEGDQVVTAGQLKLKNGTLVMVNNSVVPDVNPAPHLLDE